MLWVEEHEPAEVDQEQQRGQHGCDQAEPPWKPASAQDEPRHGRGPYRGEPERQQTAWIDRVREAAAASGWFVDQVREIEATVDRGSDRTGQADRQRSQGHAGTGRREDQVDGDEHGGGEESADHQERRARHCGWLARPAKDRHERDRVSEPSDAHHEGAPGGEGTEGRVELRDAGVRSVIHR